jgi:hypothetical protein
VSFLVSSLDCCLAARMRSIGSLNLDDAQERVKESTHLIFVELVNVVRDEPS